MKLRIHTTNNVAFVVGAIVVGVLWLGFVSTIVYVAAHFISKWW